MQGLGFKVQGLGFGAWVEIAIFSRPCVSKSGDHMSHSLNAYIIGGDIGDTIGE